MTVIPEFKLNDGTTLPAVGLGTYKLKGASGVNLEIFDFQLTDGEMASITGLGRPDGRTRGQDPAVYEEF